MYDFSIVTLHRAENYGAALQTYALKTFLTQMGFDGCIYNSKELQAKQTTLRGKALQLLSRIFSYIYLYSSVKRKRKFKELSEKYFNLNTNNDSRVYIAGSDQVWNPILVNTDYYLDFVSPGSKKASYAASIGVSNINEQQETIYKKYLPSFEYISVREDDARKNLERILNRHDISVNVDPTLLLKKEDWTHLVQAEERIIKEEYTLLYILHVPSNINSICGYLKKRSKTKLVLIDNNGFTSLRVPHDIVIRDAGPLDFLNLVMNANSIVTTSFHGTVFSILFEKKFYSVINPLFPSRVSNLLNRLGIEGIYEDERELHDICIDYENVNNILDVERRKSKDYLASLFE